MTYLKKEHMIRTSRVIILTLVNRRGLVEEEWSARVMQRDWQAIVMVQERDNKPGLGW